MKVSYFPIAKVEKKEQNKFVELKKDDEVEFDIDKTFTDENTIARVLNVAKEDAKKAEGKYKGRRKITDEVLSLARTRIGNGEPLSRVANDLKVSRETLYKYGIKSVLLFGNHKAVCL